MRSKNQNSKRTPVDEYVEFARFQFKMRQHAAAREAENRLKRTNQMVEQYMNTYGKSFDEPLDTD